MKRIFLTYTLLLILTSLSYSQQKTDSLYLVPIDTVKKTDTSKATGNIDAVIEYSAKDSAVFDLSKQQLMLYNNGDLKYKEFELKAAVVILHKDNSTLESYGVPDTVKAGKFMGTPVFFEGTKKYEGEKVTYNFKTRKGNITMGTTEMEGGYYLGEKIKKVSNDVFFIKNGRYTTCDKADPDFYFASPKMKIIQGDKVIAEPVYLFVDDVPVFAIPFGIFPNHTGRSSGIITPAYGEDATYGRYLSHLGYFWAVNDYMDLAVQGNYYTKGRIDLDGRYRYALRYKFAGSLEVGGNRTRIGEPTDLDRIFSDDWRIALTHNQTIDPTTSISADLNFMSSKNYYNNSSNNMNDLLLQHAISNFTLSKYWEGTPNSLSLNYYRDQNLETGETSERIPSAVFTRTQSFPFRSKNTSLLDLKWYEVLSYDYSAQFLYQRNKSLQTDISGTQTLVKDYRGGLKQTLGLGAPIKLSQFSVSPFVSYNEIWYNKSIIKNYNSLDSQVTTVDVPGFKAFRYFSTGVSLDSRIIGIFNTNILGIKGFRHTLTPSLSYNYMPDFSKPFWKAWTSYTDVNGRVIPYSYFEKEVFGTTPVGEAQSLGFSLGNIFEIKTKPNDTTENKFQVLNLNAGISYNFAADSLRLSELGLSYRTQIGSILSIGGAASFNFYKYIDSVGRINKFLWNTDRIIANLTGFNINVTTSFQSEELSTGKADTGKVAKSEEYIGIYSDKPPNFRIPWSVSFNYNYTLSKPSPSTFLKSSNIMGSLSFSLTQNWKLTITASYDIFQKQIEAPYITIYRDLHCWEMNFNWIPLGAYRGFRVELRVKAPQLQDLKVTKETNYRGVF
ncbi:MAG: putative LPS assembly protein LptD [Ignavibacteria bacterium]